MIYPIEGYVIVCDKCGEKETFYENSNEIFDIDKAFIDWMNEKGWIENKKGQTLCPQCAIKEELRRVKKNE